MFLPVRKTSVAPESVQWMMGGDDNISIGVYQARQLTGKLHRSRRRTCIDGLGLLVEPPLRVDGHDTNAGKRVD